MRGAARCDWLDGAIASMLEHNAESASLLMAHDARAMTDVTGFGLLGHLVEMLGDADHGAHLRLAAIPALEGALACLERGYQRRDFCGGSCNP